MQIKFTVYYYDVSLGIIYALNKADACIQMGMRFGGMVGLSLKD